MHGTEDRIDPDIYGQDVEDLSTYGLNMAKNDRFLTTAQEMELREYLEPEPVPEDW